VGCAAGLIFLARRARVHLSEPWLAFAAALCASWICVRLERRSLASIGFQLDLRAARQFGAGIVLGLVLMLATALLVWLLGGFHLTPAATVRAGDILRAGLLMLGAVLFEETLFRGYAFQRTVLGLGPRRALLLFAALFVLAHPMGPEMSAALQAYASLNIFLAAVLLGLCYLRSGSLALPVGLHLGWNWSMETLGFAVSGNHTADSIWVPVFDKGTDWLTGGPFGLEASAVSLPVLGAAVAWFALGRPAGLQSRP
ncbi:MAG TPA: CPBP family intramembrane glutamic endopeptidase, partial [Telluria sp.]|nr:CPBP family intramembrane glutamic endopeptidase [Telluria sp.]